MNKPANAILRYLHDELEQANTSYRPEMEGSEVGPYMRGWIAAIAHVTNVIEKIELHDSYHLSLRSNQLKDIP